MNNKKTILLVEDDEVDALAVKRAIKELHITNPFERVVNGLEALEFLHQHSEDLPCIILLDLNMPKMNGVEFLTEMKKNESYRKIPVVVLTTSRAEIDVNQSFSIGVAGYMVKPVDYKQLVEVVKEIKLYWTISELPT